MDIVFDGEAKVSGFVVGSASQRVLTAAQQLHDCERKVRESQGIGLSPSQKEIRKGLWIRIDRQSVAHLDSQGFQTIPALRRTDDTTNRRYPSGLQITGSHAVCGDHEVLDECSCAILSLALQLKNAPVVDYCARFDCFESS